QLRRAARKALLDVSELSRIGGDPRATEPDQRRLLLRERGQLARAQRLVSDDRFPVHVEQLVEREPRHPRDDAGDFLTAASHAHAQPQAALTGGGELARHDDAEPRLREERRAVAEESPCRGWIEVDRLGTRLLERAPERREEPRRTSERFEQRLLRIAKGA